MAFANGFNGDQVQLDVIVKTLEDKLYIRPGVTCHPEISVTAAGEALFYYTRSASTAGDGVLGSQHTYVSGGVKKHTLPFEASINIDDVIPGVNFQTVSADVVGDKVVQETMTAANRLNEKFLTATETAAEAATTTWDADKSAYDNLLALRAEFVKENKADGMKPTAAFVSPDVYSELLAKNVIIFKDGKKWGDLMGFEVIEAPDMTATLHAVMLNAKGMIAAQNINSLVVADGTPAGYPAGTIIAGEIGYVNAATDLDRTDLKPILKF